MESAIKDKDSSATVENCSSLRHICSADSTAGYKARLICPETCGCKDPGGMQILWSEDSGCPPTCFKSPEYRMAMESRSCSDQDSSKFLDAYVKGLDSYLFTAGDV